MDEFMAFYAPTVNSYKRFQAGSWAPTAMAWSPDNRTAGFRVVGVGSSLRIECRIPGADVNPYLAYSAVIASGLGGYRRSDRASVRISLEMFTLLRMRRRCRAAWMRR